jgi:hypothetical protein
MPSFAFDPATDRAAILAAGSLQVGQALLSRPFLAGSSRPAETTTGSPYPGSSPSTRANTAQVQVLAGSRTQDIWPNGNKGITGRRRGAACSQVGQKSRSPRYVASGSSVNGK